MILVLCWCLQVISAVEGAKQQNVIIKLKKRALQSISTLPLMAACPHIDTQSSFTSLQRYGHLHMLFTLSHYLKSSVKESTVAHTVRVAFVHPELVASLSQH